MSTAARIDELRKKFDENPRRYFAPLANEYRKAGDLSQAIALCRDFLPTQPGHMSGHIVFGQALFEAGELGEARSVFEAALALDPENLIALRHLGDIAKAMGDPAQARRWYERVLDADPRNDDIAVQLSMLGGGAAASVQAPASPTGAFGDGWTAGFGTGIRGTPVAPTTPTPIDLDAFATPAMGMHAVEPSGAAPELAPPIPTPDAAMRAVDVDAVNADLARGFAGRATPSSMEAVEEALDSFATHDPAAMLERDLELHEGDARLEPIETVAGATSHLADETPAGSADFEEGLVAPEWPDTTPLLARLAEPTRTPMSSSAVPIADEVAAFGGATEDEASGTQAEALAEPVEVRADAFDGADDLAAYGEPELHHDETADPEALAVTMEVSIESLEEEALEVTVEMAIDAEAAVDEPVDEAVSAAFDEAVDEAAADAADSLPWLTPPDRVDAAAVETEELAELAEAFAEGAREAGEPDEVTVETLETVETHAVVDERGRLTPPNSPAFVTETMAELLVSQGYVGRAIEVYEELARRHPYDPVLSTRLAELRDLEADASDAGDARSEAPAEAAAVAFEEPADEDRTLTPADVPSADATDLHVAIPTPIPNVARRTPLEVPAAAPGEPLPPARTARQWFATLAARRVPRRTPPQATRAVTVAADGLSSLFGTAESAGTDDLAARVLAEAFSMDPMAPAPTPPTAVRPADAGNAGFSFDRFFPDPAVSSGVDAGRATPRATASMPLPSPSDASAPVAEDLANFSEWLKGLDNG
jgi:tetratricopeptide (TPR) repeat protein